MVCHLLHYNFCLQILYNLILNLLLPFPWSHVAQEFLRKCIISVFLLRSISRVYLSAGNDVIGGRGSRAGEEPRLTSWKKTGDTDLSLPPLPARRPQTPPPSRPPKPRGSNPPTDDEESKKDSASESSVWYEYGCVQASSCLISVKYKCTF